MTSLRWAGLFVAAWTLQGCALGLGAPPTATTVGAAGRVVRGDGGQEEADVRPDVRVAAEVTPLIDPAHRTVDLGFGYMVQPAAASRYEGGFVTLAAPLVRVPLGPALVWRTSLGGDGRIVWEHGRQGAGAAVRLTGEVASFVADAGCTGGWHHGARGDFALGIFTEGALSDLGDFRVVSTSMGLVVRLPAGGVVGFEHGRC